MSSDFLRLAEVFSEMSVKVLAEHLSETLGPASQPTEMTNLLQMQDRMKQALAKWEQLKGKRADVYYELARERYHNEDDMQTNVDPLTGPWDVSEADFGVWIRAWVWVPNDVIYDTGLDNERKTNGKSTT